MPTGYTHGVQEGTVTEFEDFAWTCARAFGALIELRDSENDGKKPAPFVPSSYHVGALKEAQDELTRLSGLTLDQATFAQAQEINERIAFLEEGAINEREQKARYEAMLAKVRNWRPPSPDHKGLKDFMEKQLVESIDFDCGKSGQDGYYTRELKAAKEKTVEPAWLWLKEKIAKAQEDISYHTSKLAEDAERAAGRNLWVEQLAQSLEAGQ